MGDKTSQNSQSTDALDGKLNFEQNKNRIIGRDENNIARLLINANPDNFFMKISKPTLDVINATDDELIFNSGQNIFKIVGTGTLTIPNANLNFIVNQTYNNTTGNTAAHGLSFTPAVLGFVEYSGGGRTLMPATEINSGGGTVSTGGGLQITNFTISTDATYVSVIANSVAYGEYDWTGTPMFGGTRTVKYYLLQETAN